MTLCSYLNVTTSRKCKAHETAPYRPKSTHVGFTMEQEGLLEHWLFILSLTKMKVSSPPHHSAKNIYDSVTCE